MCSPPLPNMGPVSTKAGLHAPMPRAVEQHAFLQNWGGERIDYAFENSILISLFHTNPVLSTLKKPENVADFLVYLSSAWQD